MGSCSLRARPPRARVILWVRKNVSPNRRGESSPSAEPQAHHQRVLDRLAVIVGPAARRLEAHPGVEVLRRAVAGAHFEDGPHGPRPSAEVEREAEEFGAEAAAAGLLADADVVDVQLAGAHARGDETAHAPRAVEV